MVERESPEARPESLLELYYARLLSELGPQRWWPARTRLEVVLGAILTQNTSWQNACLALKGMRRAGLLRLSRLRKATRTELEASIRSAGFFRQKARTIRGFLNWLGLNHQGSLRAAFSLPPEKLRQELLELRGLGPETVDAILLYAGRRPFFVADAYTRRIFGRHGLVPLEAQYSTAQEFLHRHLPSDPVLFNEYHALLVAVGKRYCKRQEPRCGVCPLGEFLPPDGGAGSRQLQVSTG